MSSKIILDGVEYTVDEKFLPAIKDLIEDATKTPQTSTIKDRWRREWERSKDEIEGFDNTEIDRYFTDEDSENLEKIFKILKYVDEVEGVPTIDDIEKAILEYKENNDKDSVYIK